MRKPSVDTLWHPGFELGLSLQVYVAKDFFKSVDLGAGWRHSVRHRLPAAFAAELDAEAGSPELMGMLDVVQMMAWRWRGPAAAPVTDYIDWIRQLDAEDVYAAATAAMEGGEHLPPNLSALRDKAARTLSLWHEHYFARLDTRIAASLTESTSVLRGRIASGAGLELVEEVSGGVDLRLEPRFEQVVLIPQYHATPSNVYSVAGNTVLHFYPVDALPPAAGEPTARLTRMLRALNDPKRLAILRLVAREACTMTEIAKGVHLSKATIHYHLILLRAAGLLRVETNLTKLQGNLYALRRAALADLPRELASYIDAGSEAPRGK